MSAKNLNVLIPKRSIYNVVGCLCKKPQLLLEENIHLQNKDFQDTFYKSIFGAINDITMNNLTIKEITPIDIDNYLASIPQMYKVFEGNDGFNFVEDAINDCNPDIFEQDYKHIRKMSLLRDFKEEGMEIDEIFNINEIGLQSGQIKKIRDMELEDILDHFNLKMLKIKDEWNVDSVKRSYEAGDNIDSLLERLQQEPEMGYPFSNGYYNTVFRGMRYSKLMIRSAGTGVGKTRLALADICKISCSELYDTDEGKWVSNGSNFATCFISTELELEELQTCMLAFISGIDETIIKKGRYSSTIYKRLKKAMEILKESPISLHYIDDFSITDIESIIEKDIIERNVKFVFFDYIQLAPKLARTMQTSYGMGLREDQILVNLSSRLKLLCNKYDVYLATATQLNRSAKEHENRDSSAVRGSSAIIDKADHAVMCFRATAKDLENLEHILETGRYKRPNFCHYVYKNRSGRNALIIWTQIDYGTMREIPCFVTSMDYEYMPMELMNCEIEIEDNEENLDI